MLDRLARRYSRRPSEYIGGLDASEALSLDVAAMGAGERAMDREQRDIKGGIQPVYIVGGA